MNRLFSILVTLVWGVWVGGLVGVFIAVTSLNHTFGDRLLFGNAAAGVFSTFEQVQLVLAGLALVLAFGWRLGGGPRKLKTTLFFLFALATVAAVTETGYVSKQINALRAENLEHPEQEITKSDHFKRMHGLSMALYSGTVLILVVGGTLIPLAIGRDVKYTPTPRPTKGTEPVIG